MRFSFTRRGAPQHRPRLLGPLWSALGAASALVACLPVNELSDYSKADRPDTGGEPAPVEGVDEVGSAPLDSGVPPRETVRQPTPGAIAVMQLLGSTEQLPSVAANTGAADPDAGLEEPPAARDAGSTLPDAAVQEPVARRCARSERIGPNGDCYALVTVALNWGAARTSCRRRGPGWDLASVRTPADSRFLRALNAGQVWVGGSDTLQEGTWAWVDDGLRFWQGDGAGSTRNGAFSNWSGNEPNGLATSDCLRLLADARWADFECDELLGSVCQGPSQ